MVHHYTIAAAVKWDVDARGLEHNAAGQARHDLAWPLTEQWALYVIGHCANSAAWQPPV